MTKAILIINHNQNRNNTTEVWSYDNGIGVLFDDLKSAEEKGKSLAADQFGSVKSFKAQLVA